MTRDHLQRLAVDSAGPVELARWDDPGSNWNRAAHAGNQVDPFCCSTAWQVTFYEARGAGRELIVRECPGSLVAFAELSDPLARAVFGDKIDGRLFGPLESGWLFGCPLLGADGLELFAELLADFARSDAQRHDAFLVSGLERDSATLRRFIGRLSPQYHLWKAHADTLCHASLAGGLEGFLARRSAKTRGNLRRQLRRAEQQGVTFERHSPADRQLVEAVFARILAVEAASWKGMGDCGMTVEPSRDFYHRLLLRLAASGSARVMFACHQGRDIGFIFGGLAGDVYRGQQFSFVDDWRAFSIGNVLQVEMIRWLCEDGIRRYDMGPMTGPGMEYKRHWAETGQDIVTALVQRR